ncbi:MAG: hypothetical protein WCF81_24505 [Roseiarcus sp.]
MPDKPVWFITGCSTGLGRELSVILLKRGYRVVVRARDKVKVDECQHTRAAHCHLIREEIR